MLGGKEWLPGGTALRAVTQTHGRGQRGNVWEAEPGMNITMSMVLRPGPIDCHSHFLVSKAIAVGVANFLQTHASQFSDEIKIKWPNDILVNGRKIAGILIENTLGSRGDLIYSIAGIGLNVNQTLFTEAAPNAVSLSMLTGEYYDLDILTAHLVSTINAYIGRLAPMLFMKLGEVSDEENINDVYRKLLWRDTGWHLWRDAADNSIFTACIDTIKPNGCLVLKEKNGAIRRYYFKEVFPVED